jgi:peptidyl-tRNA hydrolase
MNLSGQAVTAFLKRNSNVNKSDLIFVHDDLEHKFGNVRIKNGGSAQYLIIFI